MKLSPKLLNYILKGAIALAVIGLPLGAYGATAALEAQSERTRAAQARSEALDRQQDVLTRARADIETYRPLADIARDIVPQNKDQAQTVRELVGIAASHDIALGAVTFPSSTLGSGGDRGTSLSQLSPVSGIPGMYSLEITVRSHSDHSVPFGTLIQFLDALEHNRRTAIVDGVTLQPDTDMAGHVSFTLELTEYIKP